MGDTTIQWTDKTWNPIRGCSRVSAGCEHCYAEGFAARFSGPGLAYEGLARRSGKGLPLWTGEVRTVPDHLNDPLRWRRPRRIFVNSMSDLFHEKLTNEQIAAVFGVMAAAPQHTFQVLTKRATRMREWFAWAARRGDDGLAMFPDDSADWRIRQMLNVAARRAGVDVPPHHGGPWPLQNVWLGVSCENQETLEERVPDLLATPAALKWVSAEPLLEPIVFGQEMLGEDGLGWVVVGGESGRRARPFHLGWARSVVDQWRKASRPCFVKQLGAQPYEMVGGSRERLVLKDGHGGDLAEWPEDLRVREWPAPLQA